MNPQRPRILLADATWRPRFYAPLLAAIDAEWGEGCASADVSDIRSWDLVITADERWMPEMPLLALQAREAGVPVLHLLDGILEWNNLWDNPRYDVGGVKSPPMYHPPIAHKIGCIGRAQERFLSGFAADGACEVVGLPRLDAVHPAPPPAGPTRHVLVCTANTPYFTPRQHDVVRRALSDLRDWFARNPRLGGAPLVPIWRLTKNLEHEIGVAGQVSDRWKQDLLDVLGRVDAVVTTPSTLVLESMLLGRPVARLDYFNLPAYAPSVWTVTHREEIDPVMHRLLAPTEGELRFQQTLLHDGLECRTPALPRLVALVEGMIAAGRACRARSAPLEFPRRIVPLEPDRPADPAPVRPGPAPADAAATEILHLRRRIGVLENQLLETDPLALGARGLGRQLWRSLRFRLARRFPRLFRPADGHRYRAEYPRTTPRP
jgi:hypothetical protein